MKPDEHNVVKIFLWAKGGIAPSYVCHTLNSPLPLPHRRKVMVLQTSLYIATLTASAASDYG